MSNVVGRKECKCIHVCMFAYGYESKKCDKYEEEAITRFMGSKIDNWTEI